MALLEGRRATFGLAWVRRVPGCPGVTSRGVRGHPPHPRAGWVRGVGLPGWAASGDVLPLVACGRQLG
ncbi:hypothetical protein OG923_33840 (plasmid) [Streptomyces halstedii]